MMARGAEEGRDSVLHASLCGPNPCSTTPTKAWSAPESLPLLPFPASHAVLSVAIDLVYLSLHSLTLFLPLVVSLSISAHCLKKGALFI